MNRRELLRHALAFGAVVNLPVPLSKASAGQVESALNELRDRPMWFSVDSYNTIRDPSQSEPEFRWQVLPGIAVEDLKRVDDYVALAESSPAWRVFQMHALTCQENLEATLEGQLEPGRRRVLKKRAKALAHPDGAVEYWIRMEGRAGLSRLRSIVSVWLAEPIDWDEFDWFDTGCTPVGSAKAFFEEMDPDMLSTLGIEIIEGDRPGSSYYAAELHVEVDHANARARELALPFRFRAEGY